MGNQDQKLITREWVCPLAKFASDVLYLAIIGETAGL